MASGRKSLIANSIPRPFGKNEAFPKKKGAENSKRQLGGKSGNCRNCLLFKKKRKEKTDDA